ncbi:Panacea domain-containing protein [Chloroflexota bacterium]
MDYYRVKLLNAVLFFCKNTSRCNTTKLLKLLSFFDFTHFKQTGYPSIGLVYHAWKRGPVPISFYEEIKGGGVPSDFSKNITVIPQVFGDDYPEIKGYLYKIKAKTFIDESVFTPREMKILKWLCDVYHDATANQMSEVSHLHNSPWDTTVKTKGFNQPIDYLLCIDDESPLTKEEAEAKLREHSELINNLNLNSWK